MQLNWPTYADRFLAHVVAGIARRRRALSHRGDLRVWYPNPDDTREWFALALEVAARRTVLLWLYPAHHATVRVTSTANRNRGKVIIEIDGLRLPSSGGRIVDTFEETVSLIAGRAEPELFGPHVEDLWRGLVLRSVPSRPD